MIMAARDGGEREGPILSSDTVRRREGGGFKIIREKQQPYSLRNSVIFCGGMIALALLILRFG